MPRAFLGPMSLGGDVGVGGAGTIGRRERKNGRDEFPKDEERGGYVHAQQGPIRAARNRRRPLASDALPSTPPRIHSRPLVLYMRGSDGSMGTSPPDLLSSRPAAASAAAPSNFFSGVDAALARTGQLRPCSLTNVALPARYLFLAYFYSILLTKSTPATSHPRSHLPPWRNRPHQIVWCLPVGRREKREAGQD